MNKKIYITYAGSEVERHDLDEIAVQASTCLERLGYAYEVLCAYDRHPFCWDFLNKDSHVVFLLDPYYEFLGEKIDLREILIAKKIPYTGPGFFASNKTADKIECKRYLFDETISAIPDAVCASLENLDSFLEANPKEAYVIKPTDKGGGLDVEFFENGHLDRNVPQRLLSSYGKFMIEPYIKGQEISVPVIRRPDDGNIIAFPPVSITLHGFTVFNTEAKKYTCSNTMTIPAMINTDDEKKIVDFSIRAYDLLRFNGLLRVDFLDGSDGIYFLEANSYPSLGQNFGISVPSARTVGYDQEHIIEWLIKTARTEE